MTKICRHQNATCRSRTTNSQDSAMNRIDALKTIAQDAQRGELTFPTGIDISLNIVRALDAPDCHIERAVQLVQAEPVISARVVAVANSAVYNRSGQKITDLRNAISRIGLRTTRTLATAIATRQLAGTPTEPALRNALSQLWQHTTHVAALAQVIARRVTHLDPETALFAGIVHEIGGFYLISRAKEFSGLLEGEPADWEDNAETDIGRAVLARLQVPETVLEAIESMWQGYLALPPATLSDTLLLANELAPVASPLNKPKASESQQSPIIDAAVDDQMLSNILSDSAAEVESLAKALQY